MLLGLYMEIVLATRNTDKIKEITAIMAPLDFSIVSLERFADVPEVVEDGHTLEENALKKARVIRDATGLCSLSDDTGLEVDALDGAPGVYSSRYAGEGATYQDNTRKLLEAMAKVPLAERGARFRCVVALALAPQIAGSLHGLQAGSGSVIMDSGAGCPDALIGEGMLEGRVSLTGRGSTGFGYDPVFELGSGQTLAEAGFEEKNRVSHRYRALIELRELLLRSRLCAER